MGSMNDFSDEVVREIESRGVLPRPRWQFLVRRSVFWTLALLSVLLGAAAFAVADYVFFDNEGISAKVLLESPLEQVLQAIPVLWLVAFALFLASAFTSLRYTRTGYRHRTAGAVFGTIAVTICLGLLLNTFDFGQAVHSYLLSHTSFYNALIHSRDDAPSLP